MECGISQVIDAIEEENWGDRGTGQVFSAVFPVYAGLGWH
jgi:hypothetical protein